MMHQLGNTIIVKLRHRMERIAKNNYNKISIVYVTFVVISSTTCFAKLRAVQWHLIGTSKLKNSRKYIELL